MYFNPTDLQINNFKNKLIKNGDFRFESSILKNLRFFFLCLLHHNYIVLIFNLF